MIARNVTYGDLDHALNMVNKEYRGNIRFKSGPTIKGKGFSFTLTVNSSGSSGGRRSNTGRKIAAACWHAHRDFFYALFELKPEAVVISSMARYEGFEDFEQEYHNSGNRNIGSQFQPLCYADACECEA